VRWLPHVTVAAIIEQENKFLLVEENINGQLLLNQPAGHWENGETLIEAVIRETLEETAGHFTPEYLVGIYQWQVPNNPGQIYLRFAFAGSISHFETDFILDDPIVRTVWYDYEALLDTRHQHRSPQLLQCVDDYRTGKCYSLDCLVNVKN